MILFLLLTFLNFIYSAQFGYYPHLQVQPQMMPMYNPQAMIHPPLYPYAPYPFPPPPPPYYQPYPQAMMAPPPLPSIPTPGVDAIAALLTPPSQPGTPADSNENITAQLGGALQLPLSAQSNIPVTLLNKVVEAPQSSQVGATLMSAPVSSEEKTAPLPQLY